MTVKEAKRRTLLKRSAEKLARKLKARSRGKPFTKGQSGNPKGRPAGIPNKVTTEAKAAANAMVDDPNYRAALLARMIDGTAGAMEVLLWHYAKGKPKERVEHGADDKLSDLIRQATGLPPMAPPPEYHPDDNPDPENP